MIVATTSFHFDGRHFNKLKKTAAANCSLFYKCIYALCVVLLLHFALRIARCAVICVVLCALCCSCHSELDELGLRGYDVALAEQGSCELMST